MPEWVPDKPYHNPFVPSVLLFSEEPDFPKYNMPDIPK